MSMASNQEQITNARKLKKINNMLNLNSTDMDFNILIQKIPEEAEQNFLRILHYLNEQFTYQQKYFDLEHTVFVPNIYRKKNNTFYILRFIAQYSNGAFFTLFQQLINKYPNIKFKIITLSKYRRIIAYFSSKIQFNIKKYLVNISKYNQKTTKCKYCKRIFYKTNSDDKFCSIECAEKYNDSIEKKSKRNYFSGYYMDIHHYVRSGWEHNIARILQWSQLDYDYENQKFKLSDGSIYIPDFYVHADNTFYEVKGELRNNFTKKLELFHKDYPDIRLIIIDMPIYRELIKQFPNIDIKKHIPLQIMHVANVNNVNCYRADNISYESWELNYKYYTNRKYLNDLSMKLMDKEQAAKYLQITTTRLTQLVNAGQIAYYDIKNQLMFDQSSLDIYQIMLEQREEYNTVYINRIKTVNAVNIIRHCEYCGKEFKAVNTEQRFCSYLCAKRNLNNNIRNRKIKKLNLSQSTIENKIDLTWDKKKQTQMLHQNVTNRVTVNNMLNIHSMTMQEVMATDKWNKIPEAYQNLIRICNYFNIDFEFENTYTLLPSGQACVFKLYIPADNTYYFMKFFACPNMQDKITQLIDVNNMVKRYNIKVITKREYQFMIDQFNKQYQDEEKKNVTSIIYCPYCGKEVKQPRKDRIKRYCSMQCFRNMVEAKMQPVMNTCLCCGKNFPIKSDRDKNAIQFCSDECALQYKHNIDTGTVVLTKNYRFIEYVCNSCHKIYRYVGNRKRKYCCEECRIKASSN